MANATLSDIVYEHLFPGGIPLACKDNIPAINKRIEEIRILASGKPLGAISPKALSLDATRKIVALKEAGIGIKEIAERMGMSPDACRNRYEKHKAKQKAEEQAKLDQAGYAAISGQAVQDSTYTTPPEVREKIESSEHVSDSTKMIDGGTHLAEPDKSGPSAEATIRNSQIVEESAKVDLQEAVPAPSEPAPATIRDFRTVEPEPAPATEPAALADKETVLRLFHGGKSIKKIATLLEVRVPWVRGICDKGREEAAKAAKRTAYELSQVDGAILTMANNNALPSEICVAIKRNFNESLTTSQVVQRIAEIRRRMKA